MREETSGRRLEVWEAQPTPTGFVVEYAYRTLDEADSVAVGTIVARVHEGRIARLYLTCGGNWDAATQRQVRETTGELGAGLSGAGRDRARRGHRPGPRRPRTSRRAGR